MTCSTFPAFSGDRVNLGLQNVAKESPIEFPWDKAKLDLRQAIVHSTYLRVTDRLQRHMMQALSLRSCQFGRLFVRAYARQVH